jgi:acetyl esterase/lipase
MIRTWRVMVVILWLAALADPEAALAQARRPGPRLPENVRAELNVPYAGTDDPRQMLDLYLPKDPDAMKRTPVVVWIHGGAWLGGNKNSGRGMLLPLVASGNYAGVSVAYRLSGEATWPAQIHDCKAAIRWIRAHAKQYNLDADHIGVWGSSAGGHLVAMLGTSGGVKPLEGTLGKHLDQDGRVTCVVDYFGPSDMLTIGKYPSSLKHDAPNSPESRLLGGPVLEMKEAARNASPTTFVSKDDPPFLIVHGDKDMVVPHNQSVRLTEALRKVDTDVTFITVKGGGHGGFRSPELTRRVHLFFDKYLRGQDVEISAETIGQGQAAGPRP